MGQALHEARAAVAERRWEAALAGFAAAEEPLDAADLERLGLAHAMLGNMRACADAWSQAYRALLPAEPVRAARRAFWLGLQFMQNNDAARGGGWLARAGKALEGAEPCAEHGLMMIPAALHTLMSGDPGAALPQFDRALSVGEEAGDPNVCALACIGRGQSLIATGRTDEGLAALDEAMLTLSGGELSPLIEGIVYCTVIIGCSNAFDLQRAREWTAALSEWVGAQPGLVPFRGQCLVHRSEILQMKGAWDEALAEARRAHERLGDPPGQPAIGMAFYQLGELNRVRGLNDEAEEAYREANRHGRTPQPGLSLLRLATGDAQAALAGISTALEEATAVPARCRLLPALAEIAVAAGDLDRAAAAVDELAEIAEPVGAPMLDAMCAQARGALLDASGDHAGALKHLRRALSAWILLDVPYEAARTRALIAGACRALGDAGTADLEADAAREVFAELGARPALEALGGAKPSAHGLTSRETEILSLVATGRTNKAIAAELFISEKTVARHLSNIFVKLDLSSRAEATAFAFKHGIA